MTVRHNLLLRSALRGKPPVSTMNPSENQPNPKQQPSQQELVPDMHHSRLQLNHKIKPKLKLIKLHP
ncbi:hypothetical protein Hanom_Chr17g01535041 [Helianthus anomalus]